MWLSLQNMQLYAAKYAEQRVREQGLLVVVFSIHQEVGKSRCPSAQWAAKWVRSRAATDTRAQMVWQKMCRKPLSAWVSHREGLPRCQPAGTLSTRARVMAAKPCVTGWDAWYTNTHVHTNTYHYRSSHGSWEYWQPPIAHTIHKQTTDKQICLYIVGLIC